MVVQSVDLVSQSFASCTRCTLIDALLDPDARRPFDKPRTYYPTCRPPQPVCQTVPKRELQGATGTR